MNCLMNLYPNFGITKVQKLHMNTRFSHTVGQACGNNNHWQSGERGEALGWLPPTKLTTSADVETFSSQGEKYQTQ